ncbi:ATP phosphoribosyltransferase regulatory subunit, partial [Campylobacter coli]
RHDLPLLPGVVAALDALQVLLDGQPNVDFGVDLADVDGYGYHSGIKFALSAVGWRDAVVRGGRYDDVSLAFGRARPATGFSLDLRKLA